MPELSRFAGEEMNVLADSAEVRIVVLRDQRDSERAREHRTRSIGSHAAGVMSMRTREVVTFLRERHEQRQGALSERGMVSRRHSRAHVVAELYGARLAAVFAADSELQLRADPPPVLYSDPDQTANTRRVKNLKWIVRKDTTFEVRREKTPCVVPAKTVW